ncbi:phosphotransferase [Nocardiopsis prasina]|uniref:phosphotransferase n=1 Tax=Nocardiopsis prasina TaxID=2015 RepID=UPI00034C63A4|nr:phosphotransferase [Nocardiopsis prasina]
MEAIVCSTTCRRHSKAPVGVVDRVRGAVLNGTLSRVSVLASEAAATDNEAPTRWSGVVEWTVPALERQRDWLLTAILRRGAGSILVLDCACDIRRGTVEGFAELADTTALVTGRPDALGRPAAATAATRREGRHLRLESLFRSDRQWPTEDTRRPMDYLGALLVGGAADRVLLADILEARSDHHRDAASLSPWHDALDSLARRTRVLCAEVARDVHGDEAVIGERLAGGSHARTYLRLPNDHGNRTVRKEATGVGLGKLNDEIEWLRGLEPDAGRHFADVVAHRVEPGRASMDLRFHRLPTLRGLILSEEIDADEAALWTRRVLASLRRDVYPGGSRPTPTDYVRRTHLDRVETRLAETAAALPDRRTLWNSDTLLINGVRLRNPGALVTELARDGQALGMLTPNRLVRTHGDPHFDNVLIDRPGHRFVLIDPRGNAGYDPAYDLGKVWHSVNSLYDLIHGGHVEASAGRDGIDYAFTSPRLVAFYHRVRDRVHAWLTATGWHQDDPHWMLKVRLAEAAHMCSVMPFHIAHDQRESVALACYARGVELFNALHRDLVAARPRPIRARIRAEPRRAALVDRTSG